MILSTAVSTALKVTYLLIAGCTGTDIESDDVGDCPVSSYVESWTGPVSMQECQEYIRTQAFDPEDYVPGFPAYIVKCEPKPTAL